MTGRPVVHTASTGTDLGRAVAASCSVAGIFPPVWLAGRPHLDGGFRTLANIDLAAGNLESLTLLANDIDIAALCRDALLAETGIDAVVDVPFDIEQAAESPESFVDRVLVRCLRTALIVVGEDYGEGASVIQERTHAYALKSTMCLLDPRPDLGKMVDMVEHGFRLSEASNMPAILELRIRACHVRGQFVAKDNQAPKLSKKHLIDEPAGFNYMKLAHPPVTFAQEKRKIEHRLPAARPSSLERDPIS